MTGTRLTATIYSSSAPFPGRAPAFAPAQPSTASTLRPWLLFGRFGQVTWEPPFQWPQPSAGCLESRPPAAKIREGGTARRPNAHARATHPVQKSPQRCGSALRGQAGAGWPGPRTCARRAPLGPAGPEPVRPSLALALLLCRPRAFSGDRHEARGSPAAGKSPRLHIQSRRAPPWMGRGMQVRVGKPDGCRVTGASSSGNEFMVAK